ncbi:hypothetical protein CVT26_012787, partial [Gymnopilus dilepis]
TRDALSFRFLGIPFADPFERFTYSKPFSSAATISALSYGSPCTQSTYGSDDCLFLNVYTPFLPANANANGAKAAGLKPVLFWIYGGGFTGGESNDGIFDGGNLVSRGDVVVVSANYRLGTQGFLALNDGVTNGNFGIADQITALQWVREHIASFGGDPSRITIFGQSAGAGSVRALLGAPPAFGLFHGAIAQSNLGGFGYAATYSEYLSVEEEWEDFGKGVVEAVGCGNMSATEVLGCLRAVPDEVIFNVPNAPRYIVVDGKYITTSHLELTGRGPTAPAHVMFGWMRDDGADFVGSYPTQSSTLTSQLLGAGANVTAAVVKSPLFPMPTGPDPLANLFNLTSRVGTDGQFSASANVTAAVVKSPLFPMPTGPDPLANLFNLTSRVGTDGQFSSFKLQAPSSFKLLQASSLAETLAELTCLASRCIDQATLIAAAQHRVFPSVWAYQFDRSYAGYEPIPGTCEPPATPAFPNGDPSLPYYRCHSGELYYTFGTLGQDLKPFRDANDLILSQVSVDVWTSFARSFDPTPGAAYLAARGYANTSAALDLKRAGGWEPVTPFNGQPLRIMDVPFRMEGWLEEKQCELLGYPFNFYG